MRQQGMDVKTILLQGFRTRSSQDLLHTFSASSLLSPAMNSALESNKIN